MTSLPASVTTVSLRSVRLRARLPRIALTTLVVILCFAGLKSIVRGAPAPATAPQATAPAADLSAESFAEGFVRTYLSWSADDTQPRDDALTRYLPEALSGDGGLRPTDGVDQQVAWTSVAGVAKANIIVAAQTVTTYPAAGTSAAPRDQRDTIYLSVPVARDRHGFLYIKDYPALVGAPPVTRSPQPPVLQPVSDTALSDVVGRALTNYLAGARQNLLADLTPDAVVSLPAQKLHVVDVGEVDWVRTGSRVAVQVDADSPAGRWTLRYQLDVRRTDRWYVQSLQVDPTFKGAR
jgi:hypothetical protein